MNVLSTQIGSPGLMIFPKDGGCMLYDPKEGKIERKLGEFPGCRFLANSGNWWLVLDSGSNLFIVDVFSKETIHLPSLESIRSTTGSTITRVRDNVFVRRDRPFILGETTWDGVSSDVVRGLLWVDEDGEGVKDFVAVWFFDHDAHGYISFCKNGDKHYTDVPLYVHDAHNYDGLSEMVLLRNRLYVTSGRRFVRVLDLSCSGSCKDITEGKPFPMLSRYDGHFDASIAVVTTSGEVLLVESDPCDRTWFRIYKKNLDLERPDIASETVVEVDSLGGEALLLDLGFTVPANKALGIQPDSIYFTRHNRPCECAGRRLDICAFNLVTKTLTRFHDLDAMDLMDARWFLPPN